MKATNFSSAKALKKLFTVSTFMALTALASAANAQYSCNYDWYGNWVCTDTGSNYRTSTTQEWYGNDVTTDNYGNRMSCSYDWYGNYVCN